jgi:hypothetical protein
MLRLFKAEVIVNDQDDAELTPIISIFQSEAQ